MENLNDVFLLENIQVINENKRTGAMKIRGVFQRADEANANNRIYPKAILESSIEKLDEKIKSRSLLGELDHPTYTEVSLKNASHLITDLTLEGNDVIGEAELLGTDAGKTAQQLIKDGVKIGISSRGTGTLSESSNGVKTVNDDYNMVTFDLVADPSTKGAFPTLSESVIAEDREKVSNAFNKVYGEKIVMQVIKNHLSKLKEGSLGYKRTARKSLGVSKKFGMGSKEDKQAVKRLHTSDKNRLNRLSKKMKGKTMTTNESSLNEAINENKLKCKKGDWVCYADYDKLCYGEVKYIKTMQHEYGDKKTYKCITLSSGRKINTDYDSILEVRPKSSAKVEESLNEGLKRTQRILKAAMKKPSAEKAGAKAIKKQMMKDRTRKIAKGNANPSRNLADKMEETVKKLSKKQK